MFWENTYQNSTLSYSAMASIGGDATIIILSIILSSVIIMLLLSNERIMKGLLWFGKFLKHTFGLFFYGLGGSSVIAIFYYIIEWNINTVKEGNPWLLKGIGVTLLVYIVLTLFGAAIKFGLNKIKLAYRKAKNIKSKHLNRSGY